MITEIIFISLFNMSAHGNVGLVWFLVMNSV